MNTKKFDTKAKALKDNNSLTSSDVVPKKHLKNALHHLKESSQVPGSDLSENLRHFVDQIRRLAD